MMEHQQFEPFVKDLRKLVAEQVMPCYQWYSKHKGGPRVLFRTAGMLVVMGSLTLPAIASSEMPGKKTVLTAVSLMVAILTSLNTFFRWDTTWRSRTRAAYDLQGLLASWEFRLKAAETAADPIQAALSATELLVNEAFALVGSETDEFFAAVRWPEAQKPAPV